MKTSNLETPEQLEGSSTGWRVYFPANTAPRESDMNISDQNCLELMLEIVVGI